MSTSTPTRELTRTVATRLAKEGVPSEKITVDRIYAEIQQGSRTTINSELKLWKADRARMEALMADLPDEVRGPMMALWARALEHAEKAFEQRRAEMEGELDAALERAQALEGTVATQHEALSELRGQLAARESAIEGLRGDLSTARAAAEAAEARAGTLREQLEASRVDGAARLAEAKADHQQEVATLQEAMKNQEATFRAEVAGLTERLEGVQAHVMRQVEDARAATRRAEGQLARAEEKAEAATAELRKLASALATQTQKADQALEDLAKANRLAGELQESRNALSQEVATLTGRCQAQAEQVISLEQRATTAESRLSEALQQHTSGKRPPRDRGAP